MDLGLVGFFKEDLKDSEYLRDRFLARLQEEQEAQKEYFTALEAVKKARATFSRLPQATRAVISSQAIFHVFGETIRQCKPSGNAKKQGASDEKFRKKN